MVQMSMKSKKFLNMSREEVVASMANKLAEGGTQNVFKSKRKVQYNNIVLIIAGCFLFICTMIWLIAANREKTETVAEKSVDSGAIVRNPLYKLKEAFIENAINADQYALYLKDILTRYDSVPAVYKIARPVINQNDIYSELSGVWVKVNPNIRMQLSKELPNFTFKQKDHYNGAE